MIHIIITVHATPRPGPKARTTKTTVPAIVLHHFNTKNTGKDEEKIGTLIIRLLTPFLQKVAADHYARFKVIQ